MTTRFGKNPRTWFSVGRLAADELERGQAAGIVAAYTQWHMERGLRSLRG